MNTMKLIAAIAYLQLHVTKSEAILMIEFEDGSGNKFNYRAVGQRQVHYIDLTGKI